MELKELYKVNFWDIYFLLIYLEDSNITDKIWANIEVEIKDLIIKTKIGGKVKFNKALLFKKNKSLDSFSRITTEEIAHQLLKNCEINVNDDINEFLFLELNKFESNFSNYVGNLVNQNKSYSEKANELFNNLVNAGKNTFLLSFNYSKLELDNCKNVENVHGVTNKKIIFGIEHKDINVDNKEYKFTKTYRKLLSNLSDSTHKPLPRDIRTIKFFGHSLAEADYSYFQSIFDFYSVYNTDVRIEFYFTVFNEDLRESIIKAQLQSVTNMFNVYGLTMNNRDHGKNLVHKLMLENRIHIIEVTSEGKRIHQ